MRPLSFKISFGFATLAIAVVILRYAFIAATESNTPRKAKARLIASLLFSSCLCATPVFLFCYEHSLPVFESTGVIDSVRVLDSTSKHYSAYLYIHTTTGGDITVHTSGRDAYFRPGQRLYVRYRGDIGELIEASFFTEIGSPQGKFRSTVTFEEAIVLLVGLFCIWASIKKYRRDPEGIEN